MQQTMKANLNIFDIRSKFNNFVRICNVEIANEFREQNLESNDKRDDTRMAERWEDFQPKRSESRGGPYMCVHLRRKDYVRAREGQIPTLKGAAEQIKRKMDELRAKGK